MELSILKTVLLNFNSPLFNMRRKNVFTIHPYIPGSLAEWSNIIFVFRMWKYFHYWKGKQQIPADIQFKKPVQFRWKCRFIAEIGEDSSIIRLFTQ